jgi:hypothetical protein
MNVFEKDFQKECIIKSSFKTNEQYIIYTHIYGHTIVDAFGSLVSSVINKKT